jgi:hypothetical protein
MWICQIESEDIIQQEKDRIDWASVEDFEVDDEDDNSDDGFWNQK